MHDHTSQDCLRPPSRTVELISAALQRFGRWWFAADDARARRLGLQVQVIRGGLGRSYRDPRLDRWLLRAWGRP